MKIVERITQSILFFCCLLLAHFSGQSFGFELGDSFCSSVNGSVSFSGQSAYWSFGTLLLQASGAIAAILLVRTLSESKLSYFLRLICFVVLLLVFSYAYATVNNIGDRIGKPFYASLSSTFPAMVFCFLAVVGVLVFDVIRFITSLKKRRSLRQATH